MKSELQIAMDQEQVKVWGNREEEELPQKDWYQQVIDNTGPTEEEKKRMKGTLEETLSKLAENIEAVKEKFKATYVLDLLQAQEYELTRALNQVNTELDKSTSSDAWEEMIYTINKRIGTLITWEEVQFLRSGQERRLASTEEQSNQKVEEGKITEREVTLKALEALSLLQIKQVEDSSKSGEEEKKRPPLKCYYCHEEGHFKRNCPHRELRKSWSSTLKYRGRNPATS